MVLGHFKNFDLQLTRARAEESTINEHLLRKSSEVIDKKILMRHNYLPLAAACA